MSVQRTGSKELDASIAADSFAPSESVAANIPPELFENILAYVGDERLLVNGDIFDTASSEHVSAIAARRDEMRHLSVCTLTCVYWAQLTRERMFPLLILRSSKEMSGLLSLLRAPQSPRITPICSILRELNAFYTLGDHLWFHNLADLGARYRVSHLDEMIVHITGPATPAFVAASTRGTILHPLFFTAPRIFPVVLSDGCNFCFYIQHIHLPNPTMLFHLLQDCLSLRPHGFYCGHLTWNLDPAFQATPSLIGLKYACRARDGCWSRVSGCTDDVLMVTMLKSVSYHEFSQAPRLNPPDTSCLFDFMRATWCGPSLELKRTDIAILSDSGSDSIQQNVAVRLPVGTDFCLKWGVDWFQFSCIASLLPHAPAVGNNVRIPTYIIICLQDFDNNHKLRRHMKTANIDWDTFLFTIRQFPHLRQIVIQRDEYPDSDSSPRQILVEFLAHLGEAWFSLDELLGLYYRERGGFEWVQLRLDTLMDEIKQVREEIKAEADAEKAASSKLESSVVAEESESSTHSLGNE